MYLLLCGVVFCCTVLFYMHVIAIFFIDECIIRENVNLFHSPTMRSFSLPQLWFLFLFYHRQKSSPFEFHNEWKCNVSSHPLFFTWICTQNSLYLQIVTKSLSLLSSLWKIKQTEFRKVRRKPISIIVSIYSWVNGKKKSLWFLWYIFPLFCIYLAIRPFAKLTSRI